jgi:hypothetical protein
MEAGKNSVIHMGLISGPNKADDTCGPTTVTGTMDRGFTVFVVAEVVMKQNFLGAIFTTPALIIQPSLLLRCQTGPNTWHAETTLGIRWGFTSL